MVFWDGWLAWICFWSCIWEDKKNNVNRIILFWVKYLNIFYIKLCDVFLCLFWVLKYRLKKKRKEKKVKVGIYFCVLIVFENNDSL